MGEKPKCPKCGSEMVAMTVDGRHHEMTGTDYKGYDCPNCGTGRFVSERQEDVG